MRLLILLLVFLLIGLQYRLWVGENGLSDVVRLEREIVEQQKVNRQLSARNDVLKGEVAALKAGLDGVEARAREDLGMIKQGETFFMVPDSEQ